MKTQPYQLKNGQLRFRLVLGEDEYRALSEDYCGFCVNCGQIAHNVEPDARCYDCDSCGTASVYGIEELLLSSSLSITDREGGSDG